VLERATLRAAFFSGLRRMYLSRSEKVGFSPESKDVVESSGFSGTLPASRATNK
jgi:hypothetical protein